MTVRKGKERKEKLIEVVFSPWSYLTEINSLPANKAKITPKPSFDLNTIDIPNFESQLYLSLHLSLNLQLQ